MMKAAFLSFLLALSLSLPVLAAPAAPAEQIKFLYMKQSGYDLGDIVERAESFRKETGIRVVPQSVNTRTDTTWSWSRPRRPYRTWTPSWWT